MANLFSSLLKRLPRVVRRHWFYAIVSVEDPSGRSRDYWFSRRRVGRGLAIGSHPACDVRLTGSGVRPVHARLQPMSNHWVLKFMPEGQRLPLPKEFEGQYDHRVDRVLFDIEGHRLLVDDA